MIGRVFQITSSYKNRRWIFPNDSFVVYESEDQSWCEFFGIGKWEESIDSISFPNAVLTDIDYTDQMKGKIYLSFMLVSNLNENIYDLMI